MYMENSWVNTKGLLTISPKPQNYIKTQNYYIFNNNNIMGSYVEIVCLY